jgi:methanogenic corrinoid protein MtbC1
MMVELVLKERGYKAFSLGTNLPLATLRSALRANRPRLFWLSVSFLADSQSFLENFGRLSADAAEQDVMLIVGGRALTAEVRQQMEYTVFCDTLRHSESFLDCVN